MDAFEFSRQAIKTCSEYSFIQRLEILLLDEPVAKIKAEVVDNIFINIFYNAETLKLSFSLINGNRRIFGADNLMNWHMHPFENPELHVETAAVSLADFLDVLLQNQDKWRLPKYVRRSSQFLQTRYDRLMGEESHLIHAFYPACG